MNGVNLTVGSALIYVEEFKIFIQFVQSFVVTIVHKHFSAIAPVEGWDSPVIFIEFILFGLNLNLIVVQILGTVDMIFLDKVDYLSKMTTNKGKTLIFF